MKYRLLWSVAATGIALHLLGIGWDAYLHAQDSTLAAREGIFTLKNPSHILIIAGLGLTAAAVMLMGIAWLEERNIGGQGRLGRSARAMTVPIFGLATAGAFWLAAIAQDQSADAHAHLHGSDDASGVAVAADHLDLIDATGQPAVAASGGAAHQDSRSQDPMDPTSAHFHSPEVKVDAAQLVAAARFYTDVKAATARYEDIKAGLADGFVQVTPDLEGIAAHFHNAKFARDGILLDPERPETLLYSKRVDGTWRLVGVMFSSETPSDTPPSAFGALDAWHRHENLCFTGGARVRVEPSEATCTGGVFVKVGAWNLHVWTMEGASGVFAHDFDPIKPGTFPAATRLASQEVLARQQ